MPSLVSENFNIPKHLISEAEAVYRAYFSRHVLDVEGTMIDAIQASFGAAEWKRGRAYKFHLVHYDEGMRLTAHFLKTRLGLAELPVYEIDKVGREFEKPLIYLEWH